MGGRRLKTISQADTYAPVWTWGVRLRLRLETLTFGGVVTRYAFNFTRHAGFTPDDLAYLRWNAQRNAPFLAPDPKADAK